MKFGKLFLIPLLLMGLVMAVDPISFNYLNASLANANCRLAMATSVVDSLVQASPNSTYMGQYLTPLQSDISNLQNYADSGDTASYGSYMSSTFDPDLQALNAAVAQWKKNESQSLSNDTRQTLRTDYSQYFAAYQACDLSTLKQYGLAKVAWYEGILNAGQNRSAMFGSAGLDNSAMSQVLQEAQSQIVAPLQNSIESADNASQIRSALQEYCLYDGCKHGPNFHLTIQFEIARVTASLDRAQNILNASNSSVVAADLAQAQTDLDSANSLISSINGSAYQSGQSQQLAGYLNDATKNIDQALMQGRQQGGPFGNGRGRGFGNGTRGGGNYTPGGQGRYRNITPGGYDNYTPGEYGNNTQNGVSFPYARVRPGQPNNSSVQ
jgi:hypothetical protein